MDIETHTALIIPDVNVLESFKISEYLECESSNRISFVDLEMKFSYPTSANCLSQDSTWTIEFPSYVNRH